MIKKRKTAPKAASQRSLTPSQRSARTQDLKAAHKGRKTAPKAASQRSTPLSQAPKNTQRLASSAQRRNPVARNTNQRVRRNYTGNRSANRR